MKEITAESLRKKIDVIFGALNKPNTWYTGLGVKKYLTKNLFAINNQPLTNPVIESGRWSTYAHFSPLSSFENLLQKCQVSEHSTVLVHPLLPQDCVELIIKAGGKLVTLDIDKTTLQWDPNNFKNLLTSNPNISLVIPYSFNGLYQEITQNIAAADEKSIPTLVFINNEHYNLELFDLINIHTLGGVILYGGTGFLDKQLEVAMDVTLTPQNWYFSWFLETRTRSILEYHLSQSHEIYQQILYAYCYLLLEKYKKYGLPAKLFSVVANNFLLRFNVKNAAEAQNIIKENYYRIHTSAVPDVVFDLQIASPEDYEMTPTTKLVESGSLIQSKNHQFYEFFSNQVPLKTPGSIEIPELDLARVNLQYLIYTTELDYWLQYLKAKGIAAFNLPPIHQALSLSDVPNTQFIQQYGLLVDTVKSLNVTL